MAKSEEKRHRKRVPLACLNCKKRKVRCDKKKPCSGCVRNNVGHLCVYKEPEWAESLKTDVTDLDQYRKLQADMEIVIQSQQVEIDRLRAELRKNDMKHRGIGSTGLGNVVIENTSQENRGLINIGLDNIALRSIGLDGNERSQIRMTERTVPSNDVGNQPGNNLESVIGELARPSNVTAPSTSDDFLKDSTGTTVSILRKIQDTQQVRSPHIGANYKMEQFQRPTKATSATNLYLWLNIVKLDPQLTALWYRITTMQKSYHIYKTMMLKQRDLPARDHAPCPVVACEFNMMVEESRAGSPERSDGDNDNGQINLECYGSDHVSRSNSQAHISVNGHDSLHSVTDQIHMDTLKADTVALLTRIQRLWHQIRSVCYPNLSYEQLVFLIDFYLGDSASHSSTLGHEVESQYLFVFFRDNILSLFRRDGTNVVLDLMYLPERTDEASIYNLQQKGVFLLMVALIVDESLDVLMLNRNLAPEVKSEFGKLFPADALEHTRDCNFDLSGNGSINANISGNVGNFNGNNSNNANAGIINGGNNGSEETETDAHLSHLLHHVRGILKSCTLDLLLGICLCVALLNRYVSIFKKFDHVRSAFSAVFEQLHDLDIVLGADPMVVYLEEREDEMRLILCQAWANIVRIINVVTVGTVPIARHLARMDELLDRFLDSILKAEESQAHLRYLKSSGNTRSSLSNVAMSNSGMSSVPGISEMGISVSAMSSGMSNATFLPQMSVTPEIMSVTSLSSMTGMTPVVLNLTGMSTTMAAIPDTSETTSGCPFAHDSTTVGCPVGRPKSSGCPVVRSDPVGQSTTFSPGKGSRPDLVTTLYVHYVLSRATILLRKGIAGSVDSPVSTSELLHVASKAAALATDMSLMRLRMTRYFEARAAATYVDLYLSYVVFLQNEDSGDIAAVSAAIPALFSKFLDANKFLQGSVIQFSKGVDAQYVLEVVAETVARIAHLAAGLLIRFVAGDDLAALVYLLKIGMDRPTIPVSTKDAVIREIDRTIQLLDGAMSQAHRASKIWRFYMTFIRNSHRMEPASYAKLHANAFGSGKFLDMCPVMPKGKNLSKGSGNSCPVIPDGKIPGKGDGNGNSCPVMNRQINAGVCPVIPTSKGCPVNHISKYSVNQNSLGKVCPVACIPRKALPVDIESRKRLYPFDHEPRTPVSFNESNIRGSLPKVQLEPDARLEKEEIKMEMDGNKMEIKMDQERNNEERLDEFTLAWMPQALLLAPPVPFTMDMMDWDTLPNFSFDLGDDPLMQLGADFAGPVVEGIFQ